MSETVFKYLASRSSFVSTQRKVWLFVVSLVLAGAVFAYYADYANTYVTPAWLTLMIVFLSLNLGVGVIAFLIVSAYRQRLQIPSGEQDNFILGIDALGRTVIIVATLGSILPVFSIPFHQFLTSFSLVGVATVIVFKDIIGNFIDGYRLMFSRDLLIGDYVQVNDSSKGVIRDITFHSTKLRTDDGNVLYIPNSALINGEVINFSKMRFKRITVPFTVSSEVLLSLDRLEEDILKELTTEFADTIDPGKVFLRVASLEPEKSECSLEISVDHYSFKIEKQITKFVYRKVASFTSIAPECPAQG